jgi:arylsulfatase A-like enzyme
VKVRRFWWRRAGVALVIIIAGALAALAVAPRPTRRPNVLFILVDTLRADRVGAHGRGPSLTPFLDELAEQSLVYERAYAPSSWTIPSIASLFVGQMPFEHRVLDFADRLPRDAETLAETFRDAGVETAAFVASGTLTLGEFERGFTTWQIVGEPDILRNPDGAEVNAAVLEWFDRRDDSRPFFAYLHYLEPHMPYVVHPGFTAPRNPALAIDVDDVGLSFRTAAGVREDEAARRTSWGFDPLEHERLIQLYDGEVAYLDDVLRRLFADLEMRHALDETIVVLTADHGEELGEHGLYSHAVSLYEPEIEVPLILYLPGDDFRGRIATPVGTAALGATLLAATGIPSPATFRVPGLPLAAGAPSAAEVVSQLGYGKEFAIRVHRAALVQGTRKLVVTPDDAVAVYELADDPGEERAAAPTAGDRKRVAAADMAAPAGATDGTPAVLPPEVRERLRALGYLDP